MTYLATVTIGAALMLGVVQAPATGIGTVTDTVTTASVQATHHKPVPRCPPGTWLYRPKNRKGHTSRGRCIGPGSGIPWVYRTPPPGLTPNIVTFGNGAGSGITTFGHRQGVNPNSGTGPFGHLGGTTVGP